MNTETKRQVVGAVVVLAIAAVAFLLGKRAIDNSTAEKEQRRKDAEQAEISASDSQSQLVDEIAKSQQTPQELRIQQARDVWEQFDGLRHPELRTSPMLLAHRLQANQVAANLPAEDAAAILAFNAIEYRKRLPDLIIAGEHGRAVGSKYDTIVPSDAPARCAALASAWMGSAVRADLVQAGFTRISCDRQPTDGGTRAWSLK